MKLLAHALIRDVGPLPRLDQGTGWVCTDGIAAACTCAAPDARQDTSRALYHAGVVALLHAQRTVIPLRFGTLLSGPEELRSLVRKHAQSYLAILEALDGCDEFGIRLVHSGAIAPRPGSAAATMPSASSYMLRRREEIALCDRIHAELLAYAADIRATLSPISVHSLLDESRTRTGSQVSIDVLIRSNAAEDVRAALADLRVHPAIHTQLSGPWPPYRFSAELCRHMQLSMAI